jgi:hypothetical protein
MPCSEIAECADCLESFCLTCDIDAGKCPDCSSHLCEGCKELAVDDRRGRCYTCDDPELADTTLPQWVREGGMKKRWLRPGGADHRT